MRIRVSNKGNIAPNGQRGDLYIQTKVKEDSHFVRHDDDIYFEAPIFFTQVALGAKIKVPSLKGELELEIPKNVKDKQQFKKIITKGKNKQFLVRKKLSRIPEQEKKTIFKVSGIVFGSCAPKFDVIINTVFLKSTVRP